MTDMHHITHRKNREAMRDWLSERPFTHMITLQPNRQFMSCRFNEARLQQRGAGMNREILGPKWLKHTERRLGWIAFAENLDTNPHWHLLLELTVEQEARLSTGRFGLKAAVHRHWVWLVPGGTTDTQPIFDSGAARYCTKQLHQNKTIQIFTISKGLRA